MTLDQMLFIESNSTGSGMQAIRKAAELGYAPVLLTRDVSRYLGVDQTGCDVLICETNDVSLLLQAIDGFLAGRPSSVGGITTTSEFYVETAAYVAAKFGFPANPVMFIQTCRNKAQTRERLTSADFLQPRFAVVSDKGGIVEAMVETGLPCVVKPCDDTSSFGVKLCHTYEEILEHASFLWNRETNVRGQRTIRSVLLEEYVDAPEYSVETFAWEGEIVAIGVTQKMVKGHPYFVEYGHIFPAELPPAARHLIEDTTTAALRLLGNHYGPIHTEVKLVPEGCVIIEINPRLAGGMIPEIVLQATGIDLLRAQLLAATSRRPDIGATSAACAGIYFFTAPTTGIFKAMKNIDAFKADKHVVQVTITASPSKRIRVPQSDYDRLGFIIFRASSYRELMEYFRRAEDELEIELETE